MRFIAYLFLILGGPSLSAQSTSVAVLGTIHLHNPNNDAVNARVGDILSEQKQAELQEAIVSISQFRPTKIAFEWVSGDTLWARHYYQAWLKGELEQVIAPEDRAYLTSEIVQLAYPIARASGLRELHPIDFHNEFPLDSAMAWAASHGQQNEVEALQQIFGKAQQIIDSVTTLSITEVLRFCNSAFFNSMSQQLYLDNIVGLGHGSNYSGSHVVEQWYRRNVRIFTNLTRVVEQGDRVLVIYGAGHKDSLDDMIKDRNDWDWVDGAALLKESK